MRNLGFIAVLAVHWLVIWGLLAGFPVPEGLQPPPFFLERVEPEKQKPDPEPKPKVPELPPDEVVIWVPAPDPIIDNPVAEGSLGGTSEVSPPIPDVGVRIDPRNPPTKPDYPPSAKRLGQDGAVSLLLLVGPDGRVIEARIDDSSGYPALDEAAVRKAKTWRFQPAEDKGKPVAAWYRTSVRFRLEDS